MRASDRMGENLAFVLVPFEQNGALYFRPVSITKFVGFDAGRISDQSVAMVAARPVQSVVVGFADRMTR